MSGKALLPGFNDDEDQEDQIKSTEADITALFRECERRLKEMVAAKKAARLLAAKRGLEAEALSQEALALVRAAKARGVTPEECLADHECHVR